MTDTTAPTARPASDIDRIADEYLQRAVELSPIGATYLGVPERQDELDDFSPEGLARDAGLVRETLDRLSGADPVDATDRVTVAAMRERLGLELERYDAGLPHMALNVIASPLQQIRMIFDLMPTDTDEQWATIARGLTRVREPPDGYVDSLRHAADRGQVAPRRQVLACISQCEDFVADDGYFATLATEARAGQDELPRPVRGELEQAAGQAAAAYRRTAERLRDELLERAPESDACGIERYRLESRYFLGAEVDLAETYRWGQDELARITALMQATAEQIKPGATIKEAVAALDEDATYQLQGTEALQRWMQARADEAVDSLAGSHFDVPDPVRTIECRIAPTHDGIIYYTGPSEDFSRPGRMWWSVPKGVEQFTTWRELTTVYHEGVPGHHLQIAQTVHRSELLNRWRRMAAGTSGHAEGWALYAEWLMADLGYMDDPGNRMGLLDGQSLRAARVVVDIGVHCGFEAPAEVGGGQWTYDKAWQFLTTYVNTEEPFLRFELDRYLGWPGQAPSYKVGERLWLQLRDDTRAAEGENFDPKAFHRRALDLGGLGLDTLRDAVLGRI